MKIRIEFEPRDLWIGVFWTPCRHHPRWLVYICFVPCLPIVLEIPRFGCAPKRSCPQRDRLGEALALIDQMGQLASTAHPHEIVAGIRRAQQEAERLRGPR